MGGLGQSEEFDVLWSVIGFRVKRVEGGMANTVAANEVDDQEHEQGAANQDGDGNLQAQLQVTKIRNSSHHVRAETADQLRGEHVDAHGSGVGAARHHVVKN